MIKKGLLKNDKMGSYEKEKGWASYRTLVNYFIGDLVLLNKITEIDESVFYNIEYKGREEEDDDLYNLEIYQYYICNLNKWDRDQCLESGLILSYSDMLECDVLCVDHYGTSWDYVLTDVKLFDDYEELKKYEESEEEEDE